MVEVTTQEYVYNIFYISTFYNNQQLLSIDWLTNNTTKDTFLSKYFDETIDLTRNE
jgi:hypothetical protein